MWPEDVQSYARNKLVGQQKDSQSQTHRQGNLSMQRREQRQHRLDEFDWLFFIGMSLLLYFLLCFAAESVDLTESVCAQTDEWKGDPDVIRCDQMWTHKTIKLTKQFFDCRHNFWLPTLEKNLLHSTPVGSTENCLRCKGKLSMYRRFILPLPWMYFEKTLPPAGQRRGSQRLGTIGRGQVCPFDSYRSHNLYVFTFLCTSFHLSTSWPMIDIKNFIFHENL